MAGSVDVILLDMTRLVNRLWTTFEKSYAVRSKSSCAVQIFSNEAINEGINEAIKRQGRVTTEITIDPKSGAISGAIKPPD